MFFGKELQAMKILLTTLLCLCLSLPVLADQQTTVLTEQTSVGKATATLPYIDGSNSAELEKQANALVRDAAAKLVKEVGGQGSVTYKVMLNRPSLVSLLLEADNGGRKAYAGLNLDLTTGKEFEVTDFFVDNDNVKAALGNYDNVLFGEEGLFVRSKKNAAYSSFVPYRDVVTSLRIGEAGRLLQLAKITDKAAGKTLRLAAAASMEKVFTQKLIPLYQQKHPAIKIEGVYDASGKLQAQIESGLVADVFISAANKQMNALSDKGYMDKSTVKPLLENKLVLIVPKSGSEIKGFNDFGKAKHPAIGDPASVPAGQYAKEALTKLDQWDAIQSKVSLGTNVTQVLNWVVEGSADAGLVYATDAALLKDKVTVVAEAPAGSLKKPVIYPIGVLAKAPQAEAAKDFAAFLQTGEAMKIFAAYGFAQAK